MATRSTLENWGWLTRVLHWSIALTVFGMLATGLYAKNLIDASTPAGELHYYEVINIHKSFGLTVIMLMAFRLIWRVSERTPILPATMQTWEKVLARTTHVLLYFGLFLMPVTGWLWASAYGEPVRLFGFKLPGLGHLIPGWVPLNGDQATLAHHTHIITAFVLMTIVGMHVIGALKNHFVEHNNVLRKMIGLKPRHVDSPDLL
jgi:cytochrome b561